MMCSLKYPMIIGLCAVLCVTALVLSGCTKPHKVDGPGMVNDLPWTAFTLTRTDSNSLCLFRFTVEESDFSHLLTGEYVDESGSLHTLETGTGLTPEDVTWLRSLRLGDLPKQTAENPADTLEITFRDGIRENREISPDTSTQMYDRFLQYFINERK